MDLPVLGPPLRIGLRAIARIDIDNPIRMESSAIPSGTNPLVWRKGGPTHELLIGPNQLIRLHLEHFLCILDPLSSWSELSRMRR
jgi:hypothetical protein